MKLNCDVIRDLLPLYAEQLTSPASTALVEAHLADCAACRAELERMRAPVPVLPEEKPVAPLRKIQNHIRKNRIVAVLLAALAVLCLVVVSAKLYTAQTLATVEEAQLWTYNTRENNADLCNLEVQGNGVRIRLNEEFSWGKKLISVQLVTYSFPRFHALLEPVVTAFLAQDPADSTRISVSNTQVLSVECADDTLYYRKGQQVYRYILREADGSIRYLYGTEQELGGQFFRG